MAGPSLQASNFGLVNRGQPIPTQDGIEGELRTGRYREAYVVPIVPKLHALADEGSYFVANNSGTGVATAAAPTSFSDTAPLFTINNVDTAQNANNKRIYLDWLRVTETAAGTAGTGMTIRGVLDYTVPSGGTLLTSLNMNTDVPKSASICQTRILPVGITQSGNSRVVIGSLVTIPAMTAPLAAGTQFFLNFGGLEAAVPAGLFAVAGPTMLYYNVPPLIIGPGAVFMLEFLITAQSGASSWTVEAGWWER